MGVSDKWTVFVRRGEVCDIFSQRVRKDSVLSRKRSRESDRLEGGG